MCSKIDTAELRTRGCSVFGLAHTQSHTLTLTYTLTHTPRHTRTHTNTHIYTHTHEKTHTHKHTYTRALKHLHSHAHTDNLNMAYIIPGKHSIILLIGHLHQSSRRSTNIDWRFKNSYSKMFKWYFLIWTSQRCLFGKTNKSPFLILYNSFFHKMWRSKTVKLKKVYIRWTIR